MLPSQMLKISIPMKGTYIIRAKWNYCNTIDFFRDEAEKHKDYQGIEIETPKLPRAYFKKGERIVLYGAGEVGKSYYEQMQQGDCEIVLWVDQKYEKYRQSGLPVCAVDQIKNVSFDYILIAVKNLGIAKEISKALGNLGIARETMVWI